MAIFEERPEGYAQRGGTFGLNLKDSFTLLPLSSYTISFLTDDIIRACIRECDITNKGVVIIHPRATDYARLCSGLPERTGQWEEVAPQPKQTTEGR